MHSRAIEPSEDRPELLDRLAVAPIGALQPLELLEDPDGSVPVKVGLLAGAEHRYCPAQ
jgi:hypothetical protein